MNCHDIQDTNIYKLISLNVGKPETLLYGNKEFATGIHKRAVEQSLFLSFENFEGDGQADLEHHGGRDKAVCVYSFDHYPYWEKQLNKPMQVGAFGENLTIAGVTEEDVYIGDIFQLGEAVVQVSQPRYPCHKLAKKHNVPDLPLQVVKTGYSGFYLRVLQEGEVSPKAALKLLESHPERCSVALANKAMGDGFNGTEELKRLMELDVLADSWKKGLSKKLLAIQKQKEAAN